MKTLKSKIVAGISALVLLFGAFYIVEAMEKKEEVKSKKQSAKVLVNQTWKYTGDETDNPLDSTLYILDSNPSCPGIAETVCTLNAPASSTDPNHPDMSANVTTSSGTFKVSQRITSALNPSSIQTNETVTGLRSF